MLNFPFIRFIYSYNYNGKNFNYNLFKKKNYLNNGNSISQNNYYKNKIYIFKFQERIKLFNIENSYFSRINSFNGNGGVIYSTLKEKEFKLNNCIFYSCSCTSSGGCIYIMNKNNIKLLKVCVSYCFSKYNQFAFILSNFDHFYNLLSINNCFKNNDGINTFYTQSGNVSLINYNCSYNFNKCYSGMCISFPTELYSNYCTIVDNYVSSYIILYFKSGKNVIVSYYNIINNNSPKGHGVITATSSKIVFNNLILINNENTLFSFTYCEKSEINNCQINHLIKKIFNGNNIFIFNLKINIIINTFLIIHYSTKYCSGDYLNIEFTKIKFFHNYYNFNLLIFFYLLIIFIFFPKIKNLFFLFIKKKL